MALAKWVIKDLSDKDLEYPEITNPEQGLKWNWFRKWNHMFFLFVNNRTIQPHTGSWVRSYNGLATLNFFVCHAQCILFIYIIFKKMFFSTSVLAVQDYTRKDFPTAEKITKSPFLYYNNDSWKSLG